MDATSPPVAASSDAVALPESEARDAINRWSQGFFRIRYLGDKIFLNKIIPCFSYNVRLQTQYEEREVAKVSVPYHGEPIDNQGTPPDPWSIVVPRPESYDERTEKLPVPHTDRVSRCPQCAGVGHIACSNCHGTGQTACSFCVGSGFTTQMTPHHETNSNGQTTVRMMPVQSICANCFNGRVSCSTCAGNGRVTCPECDGACRVRIFDQLMVRFHNKRQYQVLDTTEVPDHKFEQLKGEPIFARHAPRVERVTGLPPTVEQSGKKLLRESQAVDQRHSRLLFQDLAIERVPVHEVHYMYAGVDRKLWIYGDGHIHAPSAPWRRDRMFTIIAVVASAFILGGLLMFLLRT